MRPLYSFVRNSPQCLHSALAFISFRFFSEIVVSFDKVPTIEMCIFDEAHITKSHFRHTLTIIPLNVLWYEVKSNVCSWCHKCMIDISFLLFTGMLGDSIIVVGWTSKRDVNQLNVFTSKYQSDWMTSIILFSLGNMMLVYKNWTIIELKNTYRTNTSSQISLQARS